MAWYVQLSNYVDIPSQSAEDHDYWMSMENVGAVTLDKACAVSLASVCPGVSRRVTTEPHLRPQVTFRHYKQAPTKGKQCFHVWCNLCRDLYGYTRRWMGFDMIWLSPKWARIHGHFKYCYHIYIQGLLLIRHVINIDQLGAVTSGLVLPSSGSGFSPTRHCREMFNFH